MLFPAYFPHKPKVASVPIYRLYLKIKLKNYLRQTFSMLAAKVRGMSNLRLTQLIARKLV